MKSGRFVKYYKIVGKNNEVEIYDLFEAKITLEDGEEKTFYVYTEPGVSDAVKNERLNNKNDTLDFLLDMVTKNNGLLEQQGHNDYIYAGVVKKDVNGDYSESKYIKDNEKVWNYNKSKFDNDIPYLKMANEEIVNKNFEEKANEDNKGSDININQENPSIDNVDIVKEQSSEIENKQEDDYVGMNYAVSDIHGMYGSYMDVISKLRPKDTLFIIGDVIDRGNNGIKIILDIMERQKLYKEDPDNNPELVFLCGNHEWLFYRSTQMLLEAFALLPTKEHLKCTDRKRAKILCDYFENYEEKRDKTFENREKVIKTIEQIRKDKEKGRIFSEAQKWSLRAKRETYKSYNREKVRLDREYKKYIEPLKYVSTKLLYNWIGQNQGKSTFLDFMSIEDSEKRQEVLDFILDSHIVCSREIGDTNYLFVHAMPPKDPNDIKEYAETEPTMRDVAESYFVWKHSLEERNDATSLNVASEMGYSTICGHSPHEKVIGDFVENNGEKKLKYVDIDTGCGHKGKLTLFCLDTQEFEYIDEKEECLEEKNNKKDEKEI